GGRGTRVMRQKAQWPCSTTGVVLVHGASRLLVLSKETNGLLAGFAPPALKCARYRTMRNFYNTRDPETQARELTSPPAKYRVDCSSSSVPFPTRKTSN